MIKFIKLLCLYLAFCSSSVLTNELIEAVKKEDLIKVKELLNQGLDVNEKDQDQNVPLAIAVEKGNTELIKVLLDYGANVLLLSNFRQTAKCSWFSRDKLGRYIAMYPQYIYNQYLLALEKNICNNKKLLCNAKGYSFGADMFKLNNSDLLWFLNRVLEQGKGNLLDPIYFDLVNIYNKIQKKSNIRELTEYFNQVHEIINNYLLGLKDKIKSSRNKAKFDIKVLIAYEKLANDIVKKLCFDKNNELKFKEILKDINNKIVYFDDFVNDDSNFELIEAIIKGKYYKVKRLINIQNIQEDHFFTVNRPSVDSDYFSPISLAILLEENNILKLLLYLGFKPYHDHGIFTTKIDNVWNLVKDKKIEEAIKSLENLNLKQLEFTMILLSYKSFGLSYLKQIEYIQNNYKKELELLDGYLANSKEDLKDLINNYNHDEIEFRDRIREMAYLAVILSGSRYGKNHGEKIQLLQLSYDVAAKIASYIS